jgi:uncharacterized protein YegL
MEEEDDKIFIKLIRFYLKHYKFYIRWIFIINIILLISGTVNCEPVTANSVSKIGDDLSRYLSKTFKDATKWEDIKRVYQKIAIPEVFDPRSELKHIKKHIEKYLSDRAKMAWDAKVSLESRDLGNYSSSDVNNPSSKNFIRFINAKTGNDGSVIYTDGHFGEMFYANETRALNLKPNVNFYRIPTSSEASAVHIPTPVYSRNPDLLQRIEWSDIDQLYRRNREKIKDLSFQKFCSENGFMRYFPAAPWNYDDPQIQLDMFDCRNTEWFVDAATMSKNMIIMLDMSGSMLGQRFEIAKQTIEAILETLSDNDFFNIMPFSRIPQMLDECSEEGLLQATMRNKKLLRSRLLNVTSEGKAEYEKALAKAFTTLLNIKNGSRMTETQMGCNDVIMLITDGAPGYFKNVFELYNKNKRIRFFSFLIGEEAIDFDQVKWMACTNRGYMVHVSNMADVQEKVQHYVKVMSRPVSRQSHSIQKNNAVWGSVSKERMSNQYVISVGFPVVVEDQFMGVSAVSVPMIELIQIAHPSLLGSNSYFFMLDNNGYAMFHPQLRPVDIITKETKPTYNNMDFIHVDVQRPLSELPHTVKINCQNPDATQISILFAIEGVKRVYQQRNSYIAECIDGTHFTIGAAFSEHDNVRLKRHEQFSYNLVELDWFRDNNWRLHPDWRYCLLNDSDTSLSAEAAISTYASQMRSSGKLPELCQPRKALVDRLMLDIQATNSFSSLWDQEWKQNKENGVHLAFFVAPSGLIRYYNESLDDAYYEEAEFGGENHSDNAYKHFVLELNRKSVDDNYFKRAVRMKDKIVFDVNLQTHLWQANEEKNAYGKIENETLLAIAYKALYHDNALIGVVGIEFLYDKMASWLKQHGCDPQNEQIRCYLLDEHGYIFYTSQKDISYDGTLKEFTLSQKRPRYVRTSPIGRFFGHLNRITEWTMHTLVEKGYYKRVNFADNQAMCDAQIKTVAASSTISVPFSHLKNLILWVSTNILRVIGQYAAFLSTSFFSSLIPPTAGYTTTFKTPAGGRYPCQKHSPFYIADTKHSKMASASLLEADSAERPCKQNAAQCAIRVYANWIEKTNLLLVVVSQDPQSSCYDETQCPMSSPTILPFSFEPAFDATADKKMHISGATVTNSSELDPLACHYSVPTQRKNVLQCINEEIVDESTLPCSISPRLHSISTFSYFLSVFLFVIVVNNF